MGCLRWVQLTSMFRVCVQCTVYSVQCIVSDVQCTPMYSVYSVQGTVGWLYCGRCTVDFMYSVLCTVYSVQCTVYCVRCTVYTYVQCMCTVKKFEGQS